MGVVGLDLVLDGVCSECGGSGVRGVWRCEDVRFGDLEIWRCEGVEMCEDVEV